MSLPQLCENALYIRPLHDNVTRSEAAYGVLSTLNIVTLFLAVWASILYIRTPAARRTKIWPRFPLFFGSVCVGCALASASWAFYGAYTVHFIIAEKFVRNS